jgi:hypothetical protein
MKVRAPKSTKHLGRNAFYICAVCEDDGNQDVRAEFTVEVRRMNGTEVEWVSVCPRHAEREPLSESNYELLGYRTVGVSDRFLESRRRLSNGTGRDAELGAKSAMLRGKRFASQKPKNAPHEFRE